MINTNAILMKSYFERYELDENSLVNFAINAHRNSRNNENALFDKKVTPRMVRNSKMLYPPLRVMDSSPICDGAAAVVLTARPQAVKIAGLGSATETSSILDPQELSSAMLSAKTLKEFRERSERSFLVHKLEEMSWNVTRTAEAIETPRSNLYKKMDHYDIQRQRVAGSRRRATESVVAEEES